MDFDLTDEERIWQMTVHDFVAREVRPKAHEVDESGAFNWEAARKGATLGLLGLSIPEEYGGAGVDLCGSALAPRSWGGGGSTALSPRPTTVWHCPSGLRIRVRLGNGGCRGVQRQRAIGIACADGIRRRIRPSRRRTDDCHQRRHWMANQRVEDVVQRRHR
jgi:hypothetical protein